MGKVIEYSKDKWEEARVETSATRFLKELFSSLGDEYDPKSPINLSNILYNMGISVGGSNDANYVATLNTSSSPFVLSFGESTLDSFQTGVEVLAATAMYVFNQRKFVEENYKMEAPTAEIINNYREYLTDAVEDIKIPDRLVANKKRLTHSDKKLYKKYIVETQLQEMQTPEGFKEYKKALIAPCAFDVGFLDEMINSESETARLNGLIIRAVAKRDSKYNKENSNDYYM